MDVGRLVRYRRIHFASTRPQTSRVDGTAPVNSPAGNTARNDLIHQIDRRNPHSRSNNRVLAIAVAAYGLLSGLPHTFPTTPTEDALRPGSRWAGRYQFEPPFEGVSGPVEVEITRRDGEQFWGKYRTDRGDYELLIRGTARGGEVRWEFTEAVREKEPRFMVGNARVEGRYDADGMKVVFTHPVYRSKAAMTLRPLP